MPDSVDIAYMNMAIHMSHKCPPVNDRYSVGAIIRFSNEEIETGFSREQIEDDDGNIITGIHAEEACILKCRRSNMDLRGATLYTTMEPCQPRRSGQKSCAQLIYDTGIFGIRKVVIGVKEPRNITYCCGIQLLLKGDIKVYYIPGIEKRCLAATRKHYNGDIQERNWIDLEKYITHGMYNIITFYFVFDITII